MSACSARQEGDEMACGRCGLRWGVNDADRPACLEHERRSRPRGPVAESGATTAWHAARLEQVHAHANPSAFVDVTATVGDYCRSYPLGTLEQCIAAYEAEIGRVCGLGERVEVPFASLQSTPTEGVGFVATSRTPQWREAALNAARVREQRQKAGLLPPRELTHPVTVLLTEPRSMDDAMALARAGLTPANAPAPYGQAAYFAEGARQIEAPPKLEPGGVDWAAVGWAYRKLEALGIGTANEESAAMMARLVLMLPES